MAGKRPLSEHNEDFDLPRQVRPRVGAGPGSASGSPTPKAKVATASSLGPASGSPTQRAVAPAPVPAVSGVFSKDEWDALSKKDRKTKRHETWIERSKNWQGFEGVWKGVKVLGTGTFGIAGLFEYVGKDDKKPKQMVVKQSGPTVREQLVQESRIYKQLNTSNSVHIVKMFRAIHDEGGTGAHSKWDPSPFSTTDGGSEGDYQKDLEVCRIYLEYCVGGDMYDYHKNMDKTEWPAEYLVWRVWDCLAKALCVLETGQDDPNADKREPPWRLIVHFDIKLDNILIGEKDAQHKDPGIFKIADPAMARHIPDPITVDYLEYAHYYSNAFYKSPEQRYSEHDNYSTDIGLPTNTYAIACCIYRLIMNEGVPQELVTISFDDGWSAQKYRTFGHPLLDIEKDVYSNALKGLLFQCLSWDPELRPAAKDIIKATERALSIFEDPDTKQPGIERALTGDRKLSRVPELLTKLDTPVKGRRRYVDESVASTRSRFQDLSLGLGVGDEGVAAGGDEVEPGRPTWRVHAFEPLLPSPLTAAEQGAKDQAEYEEMLAGFTREASEV